MNDAERKLAEQGAARLADDSYRRAMALGRVQAFAHVRDELTAQLTPALRGAYAAGATVDELHVESGLDRKTLRAILRGAALRDTYTPGFGRSAAGKSVTTDREGQAA